MVVCSYCCCSCSPNLVDYRVLVEGTDCKHAHIGLYASRDVSTVSSICTHHLFYRNEKFHYCYNLLLDCEHLTSVRIRFDLFLVNRLLCMKNWHIIMTMSLYPEKVILVFVDLWNAEEAFTWTSTFFCCCKCF